MCLGLLDHLALREQDHTLATSVDLLKRRDDFNYNSEEVNLNCILFFDALVKQQQEFMKLPQDKSVKGKKK